MLHWKQSTSKLMPAVNEATDAAGISEAAEPSSRPYKFSLTIPIPSEWLSDTEFSLSENAAC